MANWVCLVLLQIPYRMLFSGIVSNRTMTLTDWQSYDKTWPHGGDDADDELDFDGLGESDKENEWVVAASSQ